MATHAESTCRRSQKREFTALRVSLEEEPVEFEARNRDGYKKVARIE